MSIERIIGIDFGTSTSVMRVKRYRDNGQSVDDRLYTAEVKFGNNSLVPTLIRKMQSGEPYFGYDAQKEHKKSTLFDSFKVDLESPDPQKREQARALTEEFFAYLAKKYKEQESMGFFGEADETEKTLVSYPVKWSDETRRFMVEAAKKAGFKNVEGMDEAQAAITAVMVQSADYLSQRGYLRDGVPANILMADMGAGTTDLVLCRYTPGKSAKYEILSAWPKNGGTFFGGREVEVMLQDYLRDKLPEEDAATVIKKCKLAMFKSWKEDYVSPALVRGEEVTDCADMETITDLLDIDVEEYSLDRAEFERLAAQYLKGFPELVNGCLKEAGLSGDEVDLVLLTGGHSQWYFVKEQLCGRMDQFGAIGLGKIKADPERIIPVPRPQETVALGLVYSPLMREIQFAGKAGKEISTELEFEINRLKREEIDKFVGILQWVLQTRQAKARVDVKPSLQPVHKEEQQTNIESEAWDESMRVLPLTPEEEFEFREVGGDYQVNRWRSYKVPNGYEVVKYRGYREDVSIPAQYKGKPVVAIGKEAFAKDIFVETVTPLYDRYTRGRALNLRAIEIPGSCKVISEHAFYRKLKIKNDSISLMKVILHPGLLVIGDDAFTNNINLQSIEIPNGVTEICTGAFWNCDLKTVNIPDSCRKIRNYAFRYNGNLNTVMFLPDARIEEIEMYAFFDTNVSQIKIPASCKCDELIRKITDGKYKKGGGLWGWFNDDREKIRHCILIERY